MLMEQEILQCNLSTSFQNATGKIDYGLTNDYMFRVILQRHINVLKALICSLLHLQPDEIKEVYIRNPIQPGEAVDDKEFVLDIEVLFNNDTLINLEMQVLNELNWSERSLAYLCRLFASLYKGQDYDEALSVVHIGFLDFQLFPEYPEFFGIYRLMNEKDHYLYSDKLTLGVVDLKHIELATEEDREFQIDHWARLFKATTWEEIKMIAENNEYMTEATQALYEYNADYVIRQKCEAREEYERRQRTLHKKLSDAQEKIQEQEECLREKDSKLQEQDKLLKKQENEIERLKALLATPTV